MKNEGRGDTNMYYVVQNREGRFNLLNPDEIRVSNWIGIYDDNGNLIKAVSVTDDEPLFFDDDEPLKRIR